MFSARLKLARRTVWGGGNTRLVRGAAVVVHGAGQRPLNCVWQALAPLQQVRRIALAHLQADLGCAQVVLQSRLHVALNRHTAPSWRSETVAGVAGLALQLSTDRGPSAVIQLDWSDKAQAGGAIEMRCASILSRESTSPRGETRLLDDNPTGHASHPTPCACCSSKSVRCGNIEEAGEGRDDQLRAVVIGWTPVLPQVPATDVGTIDCPTTSTQC